MVTNNQMPLPGVDGAIVEQVLTAGINAPSADNSQPFVYAVKAERGVIELWIDPSRSGKASDKRFVLSDIALGAVVENMSIAAQALGLSCQVALFPDGDDDTSYHVADLTLLTSDEGSVDPDQTVLAEVIPDRCTNRIFPFTGPVLKADRTRLEQDAEALGGKVRWFLDKASIKNVLPVLRQAESVRFKSQTLHRELFSTIHFDKQAVNEGMTVAALNIEWIARPFFKLMSKWSVMKWCNKIGAYHLLGFRSVSIPIYLSPGVCLVSTSGTSRKDVVQGGRILQRVWLRATALGMSVQPYAAPGIFAMGQLDVEDDLAVEIQSVKRKIAEIEPDGQGLIFLRIGYCQKKPVRVGRRALVDFRRVS